MKTKWTPLRGVSVALAVAALATFCYSAVAQEKGKAAPAAKAAPAVKTEKAPTKKPPSACKGLDEAACKAKPDECTWIAEVTTKAGKKRKAHCRSKPKSKKKESKEPAPAKK